MRNKIRFLFSTKWSIWATVLSLAVFSISFLVLPAISFAGELPAVGVGTYFQLGMIPFLSWGNDNCDWEHWYWNVSVGSLPNGLTLVQPLNEPRYDIIGTPTTSGTFNFTLSYGCTAYGNWSRTTDYSMTIIEATPTPTPLSITTTSLPTATINAPYSQTLQATGGTTPYAWSVISGSLPDGLNLDSSTGLIAGMPTTAAGTFTHNFAVQVTDANSATATQALSIVVNPASTPTPPLPQRRHLPKHPYPRPLQPPCQAKHQRLRQPLPKPLPLPQRRHLLQLPHQHLMLTLLFFNLFSLKPNP